MLESIAESDDEFVRVFFDYAKETLNHARLFPQFSRQRLLEARGAWHSDLVRVDKHEPQLIDGLDHFKRCAHLAFWLRRMSPVIGTADLTKNFQDSPTPRDEDQEAFYELLFGYMNEYLAFDFALQFCLFYERGKEGGSKRAEELELSDDYFMSVCHFMKYKTVSPHAMYLIYKSLFV